MPVRKFRSVEEMSDELGDEPWLPVGPDLWRALGNLEALAARTTNHHFPPGVYRHRSIEEAQAQRERWQAENVRRYQARLAIAAKQQ